MHDLCVLVVREQPRACFPRAGSAAGNTGEGVPKDAFGNARRKNVWNGSKTGLVPRQIAERLRIPHLDQGAAKSHNAAHFGRQRGMEQKLVSISFVHLRIGPTQPRSRNALRDCFRRKICEQASRYRARVKQTPNRIVEQADKLLVFADDATVGIHDLVWKGLQ